VSVALQQSKSNAVRLSQKITGFLHNGVSTLWYFAVMAVNDSPRSLFAQRDVDAEFVFVDDASPDGSVDRLHEVMAEYPAVGNVANFR